MTGDRERLGEILVLLHGARQRYRTVRATVRSWAHHERSEQAFARHVKEMRGSSSSVVAFRREGPEPPPKASSSVTRLWWAPPGRIREERESLGDGHTSVHVDDGERWWLYSSEGGLHSHESHPGPRGGVPRTSLDHLLDPGALLPGVDLVPLGEGRQAGRPAWRVRGVPRPVDDPLLGWPGGPGAGADEHEMWIDAERGVLLRLSSRIAGEEYQLTEVLEIAFDEDFPDETFTFVPPPGVQAVPVPAPPGPGRPEHVPLHEAARKAPFTVVVPTRVPEGTRLLVEAILGRPHVVPIVILSYLAVGWGLSVIEMPADAGIVEDAALAREVVRDGRSYRVIEASLGLEAQVRFTMEGTDVRLSGDLPLDDLLEVAASFVPAPTEPPALEDRPA